ncbi:MAG TPA: bifunctional 4-hydroxy-2-oxoglutarate aldolase/2-dehydro-3-deoxy-phosphogluconate aldolase [Saprospiraceae bacterium]|nr:bifunctional 4-hydroxy-2-oxoglutarate aldolase/2-dehydro-3-deoxy-phosphogluconate aldolase [Saprospiraceae bacterium]
MAQFKRIEVINTFYASKMIPVFYHGDLDTCKNVVDACYKGGVRVFEFTNRGDFAHEIFGQLIKYVQSNYSDLILGVGSVIDAGTASLYMQLGANFVVSPILVEEMAKVCNRRKVLWAPGCGSLSEISKAEELGAEIVKIFPGSAVGGPAFAKAIKGPSPWTSIMPTGGVSPTEQNLKAWFDAGVSAVGMGSKLLPKELIAQKDFEAITQKVRQALEIIKKVTS